MAVYKVSVKVPLMLDIEVIEDKGDILKAAQHAAEIARKQAEAWARWRREDVTHAALEDDVSVRDLYEEVF